jgi:hypothetical protein
MTRQAIYARPYGQAAPADAKNIVVAKKFTDVEIASLLENYKDTRILKFSTMAGMCSLTPAWPQLDPSLTPA